MLRQFMWLMLDFVLGLVLTGVLAPVAMGLVPEKYRGAWTLWLVAVASVGFVAGCRRLLGLGAVDHSG